MASSGHGGSRTQAGRKLQEAIEILKLLGFGPKQSNNTAGLVLLALLDLAPARAWSLAASPMLGITPIIEFIRRSYKVSYAPNTRETVRDEAVKHFVEAGLLLRNPDNPARPTNSGKTVYQIEPSALTLLRAFGSTEWPKLFKRYMASRERVLSELARRRTIARIPVTLPSGDAVTLSPGGQNPLIKEIIEEFCARFSPGAKVVYIGDTENKFIHLDQAYLKRLGVTVAPAAKMPDVVVHDTRRDWLLLIEAVVSAGSVDAKRRKELKQLFTGSRIGLVFVSAFSNRAAFGKFQQQISWETEVWFADEPDHIIHFNGERFLGPYPDVMPSTAGRKKK